MKQDIQNGMKRVSVYVDKIELLVILNNVCDKGYIWNPSNCECKCDKFCDIG